MPGFHGVEPAKKKKKQWLFEEELRENFWLFFKTWNIQWSPGKAGRKDTEANLTSQSYINVREKDKACGQGQRSWFLQTEVIRILKAEKQCMICGCIGFLAI